MLMHRGKLARDMQRGEREKIIKEIREIGK